MGSNKIALSAEYFGGSVNKKAMDQLDRTEQRAAGRMLDSKLVYLKEKHGYTDIGIWFRQTTIGKWVCSTDKRLEKALQADEKLKALFEAAAKVANFTDPNEREKVIHGSDYGRGQLASQEKAMKEFQTALSSRLKQLHISYADVKKEDDGTVNAGKFATYGKVYRCVLLGAMDTRLSTARSRLFKSDDSVAGQKKIMKQVVGKFERRFLLQGFAKEWATQKSEKVVERSQ